MSDFISCGKIIDISLLAENNRFLEGKEKYTPILGSWEQLHKHLKAIL